MFVHSKVPFPGPLFQLPLIPAFALIDRVSETTPAPHYVWSGAGADVLGCQIIRDSPDINLFSRALYWRLWPN